MRRLWVFMTAALCAPFPFIGCSSGSTATPTKPPLNVERNSHATAPAPNTTGVTMTCGVQRCTSTTPICALIPNRGWSCLSRDDRGAEGPQAYECFRHDDCGTNQSCCVGMVGGSFCAGPGQCDYSNWQTAPCQTVADCPPARTWSSNGTPMYPLKACVGFSDQSPPGFKACQFATTP